MKPKMYKNLNKSILGTTAQIIKWLVLTKSDAYTNLLEHQENHVSIENRRKRYEQIDYQLIILFEIFLIDRFNAFELFTTIQRTNSWEITQEKENMQNIQNKNDWFLTSKRDGVNLRNIRCNYTWLVGYIANEFKVLKKCGKIRYNCTNKNCSASLLVDKDVIKVLSMLNEHTHEVIPKNTISRQIVSSHLKRKCENDLLTRLNKIIRQELRNTENDIQPRKSMYDKRRKNMQKILKSLEEAITQLFDSRENIITNTGELFCHTEETSSPVLFT
ncbi:hypothetical protein AGLY_012399 [Aphis glycines]|uniref:FLYWCH-type domain-containing protein n=1 Tax=Aphis glycines TaxID=307491 RepID=A0A6G0TC60_APHGL|nr:hypothetical protein AGLY_012399 [Aphis glycines]